MGSINYVWIPWGPGGGLDSSLDSPVDSCAICNSQPAAKPAAKPGAKPAAKPGAKAASPTAKAAAPAAPAAADAGADAGAAPLSADEQKKAKLLELKKKAAAKKAEAPAGAEGSSPADPASAALPEPPPAPPVIEKAEVEVQVSAEVTDTEQQTQAPEYESPFRTQVARQANEKIPEYIPYINRQSIDTAAQLQKYKNEIETLTTIVNEERKLKEAAVREVLDFRAQMPIISVVGKKGNDDKVEDPATQELLAKIKSLEEQLSKEKQTAAESIENAKLAISTVEQRIKDKEYEYSQRFAQEKAMTSKIEEEVRKQMVKMKAEYETDVKGLREVNTHLTQSLFVMEKRCLTAEEQSRGLMNDLRTTHSHYKHQLTAMAEELILVRDNCHSQARSEVFKLRESMGTSRTPQSLSLIKSATPVSTLQGALKRDPSQPPDSVSALYAFEKLDEELRAQVKAASLNTSGNSQLREIEQLEKTLDKGFSVLQLEVFMNSVERDEEFIRIREEWNRLFPNEKFTPKKRGKRNAWGKPDWVGPLDGDAEYQEEERRKTREIELMNELSKYGDEPDVIQQQRRVLKEYEFVPKMSIRVSVDESELLPISSNTLEFEEAIQRDANQRRSVLYDGYVSDTEYIENEQTFGRLIDESEYFNVLNSIDVKKTRIWRFLTQYDTSVIVCIGMTL